MFQCGACRGSMAARVDQRYLGVEAQDGAHVTAVAVQPRTDVTGDEDGHEEEVNPLLVAQVQPDACATRRHKTMMSRRWPPKCPNVRHGSSTMHSP